MSAPVVSIIVPVYNAERYLGECLDSLLGQSLEDIEVIAVDDGSTDGSAALLAHRAAADGRLKVIAKANGGAAAARNTGLAAATGDYVLFVDADDYIARRACERLAEVARREQADIVVFGGKTFPTLRWADEAFSSQEAVFRGESLRVIIEEPGGNPLMCNKLYSRALLADHGCTLDEELVLGEDNAFQFATFPLARTIAFIPDALYFYRIHGASAVGSREEDHDQKAWLHLDVVRRIARTWAERGWMAQEGDALFRWAMEFLYNESSQASFDERSRYGRAFAELLDEAFPGFAERQDPLSATFGRVAFMRGAATAAEETPEVTVVLGSLDGAELSPEALRGIELQTMQRMEVLALPEPWESSGYGRSVAALAKRDRRVRLLGTGEAASVLAGARGRYLVPLLGNDALEISAFEQMLRWLAPKEGRDALDADLVAFAGASGLDGAVDLFDRDHPALDAALESKEGFSAAELEGCLFGITSLMVGNRAFATALLRQAATQASEGTESWQGLLARASLGAQCVLATTDSLVAQERLAFSDPAQAAQAGRCLADGLAQGRGAVAQTAGPGAQRDYDRALALHLIGVLRLVQDADAFAALLEAVRPLLEALDPNALAGDDGLDDAERRLLTELAAGAPTALHAALTADTIDRLLELNQRNLKEAKEQQWSNEQLRAERRDFYRSISYRTGRAVTALPRRIVGALKKLKP